MKPLIDGDILRYEVGFSAEYGWGGDGLPSFQYVSEMLDTRIKNICAMAEATEEPTIYFTGSNNFRIDIAKTKVYKGTRVLKKPWHFDNLTVYIKAMYDWEVNDTLEADDMMAIAQTKNEKDIKELDRSDSPITSTIICTRDKDLRMVPGYLYSWEAGKIPSFGPEEIEEGGYLRAVGDKVIGTGMSFFYYQLLMGDSTDNIPGCPKIGAVKAYKVLESAKFPEEMLSRVLQTYKEAGKDTTYLREQADLLWMVRELDEEGAPVKWSDLNKNVYLD